MINLSFYIRIALLTVVMIFGAAALLIGVFMLFSGKEHEFKTGLYCTISGVVSVTGALIAIIWYNRKYQEILLNTLLQNPDTLKFSFQDIQTQKTILIGDDVLFVDKNYYPYRDFYITLKEITLNENELIFMFEKRIQKARVNHLIKVYPPLKTIPQIRAWISEHTNKSQGI